MSADDLRRPAVPAPLIWGQREPLASVSVAQEIADSAAVADFVRFASTSREEDWFDRCALTLTSTGGPCTSTAE